MPPAKKRRSPLDRFTDASPTAISAGFSAAMSLGPQPRAFGNPSSSSSSGLGEGLMGDGDEGSSWLEGLQHAAGFAGATEDASDDDNSDGGEASTQTQTNTRPRKRNPPKRKKTDEDYAKTAVTAAASEAAADEEEIARNRKAQNRIAQREFRQRKQQYIRALEARVELLSSDHDTQVDRLRHALRGLLAENNTLRSMLGSLARFIGEGMLGGPLQQTGISREELLEMINGRSEKTMTDAWQNWPGAKECEALREIRQEANIPLEGLPDMRTSPGPSTYAATTTIGAPNVGKRGRKAKQPQPCPSAADSGNKTSQSASNGTPKSSEGRQPNESDTSMQQTESPSSYAQAQAQNAAPTSVHPSQQPTDFATQQQQQQLPLPMPPNYPAQTPFAFPSQLLAAQMQQLQPPQSMPNQDDAIMASLFGPDLFGNAQSSSNFMFNGGGMGGPNNGQLPGYPPTPNSMMFNGPNAGQMTPAPDFMSNLTSASPSQFGFAPQHPQQQQQGTALPPRQQDSLVSTPSTSHNSPSANGSNGGGAGTGTSSDAPTPRTGYQTKAALFLSSLRSVEKGDDVRRLEALARRLNGLRSQQGRAGGIFAGVPGFGLDDYDPDRPDDSGDVRQGSGGGSTSTSATTADPSAEANADNSDSDSDAGVADDAPSEEEMQRLTDACIQLAYHMSNYRRNASYRLPPILRPTDLQLTRPHDPAVDVIPFARLRDAIILNQDRINVDELMFHLFSASLVAEGDVFQQSTHLMNPSFLLRYPHLATPDILEATNGWRRIKGKEAWSVEDVQRNAARARKRNAWAAKAAKASQKDGSAAKSSNSKD